jgi:hypothetical protein
VRRWLEDGDGFGEVARLIGVHAPCHGHVVREELEGDDVGDGL